jgi:preprotein translocase subunit SecD
MLNYPRWKLYLVLVFIFAAGIVATPNFFAKDRLNVFGNNTQRVNLGLDLQGGAYILLQIDDVSYLREKVVFLRDEIAEIFRSNDISFSSLVSMPDREYGVEFLLESTEFSEITKLLSEFGNDIHFKEHEKLVKVFYSDSFLIKTKRNLLNQSVEIIRRRVDETGTKEPLIQPQGMNRIIVEVPGIEDPERLKTIIGQTAKLTFHMLHAETPIVSEDMMFIPDGYLLVPSDELDIDGNPKSYFLANERPDLSGEGLDDASAAFYQGIPQVNFKFDNQAARDFGVLTSNNVGKLFAIILDDQVISAPVIREPILGGQGVISGDFTLESANDLALLLRAGALPAPIEIIEERTVGPTLGKDSVASGKKAVIYAGILVMIMMFVIYGLFGLFADIALLVNVVLIIAALTLLQATLTLPGIAGIVLVIGMAVDANVLIFERIREEARYGKSIYATIDNGFSAAVKTIIDSNLTTLLAALILYYFGSGPVRGFAVTLSIGIIASMFSAISFTRLMVLAWLRQHTKSN